MIRVIIPKVVTTESETKFKKEYESLNGKANSNDEVLKKITIPEDNNVEYLELKDAVDKIKNSNGVLFFGYPTNQKSRLAVPILINAANNTSLEKIYYLNVRPQDDESSDIRDTYTIVKKKVQKSKDAEAEYYELLKLLDSYLPKYKLINTNGETINVGEKRLNVPTLISFDRGKILGYVEGTTNTNEYDADSILKDLSTEEQEELHQKYTKLLTDYLDADCSIEAEEGC